VDIYDKLGVRKIINAWGTITAIGGSRMPPECFQAMAEAGRSFVFLDELHIKAGQYVAQLLGVEAAYISSGAAGGIVLAAAACLTGTDQQKICALPKTDGWANEIIVQKAPGPTYVYQGMTHVGAHLVEVGTPQQMTVAEIEQAVSDRTAAIMLYLDIRPQPSIAEVSPIARRAGVPLIVDAAAELPPRRNLTEPLKQGADLVVFSGGKGVLGPQGTGLVVGRKGLIEACRLNGNPHNAIGRPMKVGKEDIAAFIAALERFMARDEEEEMQEYARRGDRIVRQLAGIEGIVARTLWADPRARPVVPRVYIDLEKGFALTKEQIRQQMLDGEPSVAIGETDSGVSVALLLLNEEEVGIVARRLEEVLRARPSQ
jgi:uncharacterized pyridoxal phosphate-dependent enzyme